MVVTVSELKVVEAIEVERGGGGGRAPAGGELIDSSKEFSIISLYVLGAGTCS